MRYSIILILIFTLLKHNIFAYPISPRPLRTLVIESQFIIVGYVVKTYHEQKQHHMAERVAKIAVLENLQGEINKDTLHIPFEPNMICPAPAVYYDSTYVISFLEKDKKTGEFYTYALSYGAKTLSKEGIAIYKQRIFEMQQILTISDKEKKKKETIEWLVKCAESEITRWEGTFELSPESNFMSYYSRNKKQNFKDVINVEQKERLKISLFDTKDYIDFGLVDLVYKSNETVIDNFLISKLKSLKEDDYWIFDDFVKRLKHKNTSEEMVALLEGYEKKRFTYVKNDEIKDVIDKFIRLIEK